MSKNTFVLIVAGAMSLTSFGGTAIAQNAGPSTVGGMIGICAPVIDEQYNKDMSRWGACIAAADAFLKMVIPTLTTQEEVQATVALTVEELVKLYRPQSCKLSETELPLAISTARSYTVDEVQLAAIDNIALAIGGCQQIETAAIQSITSEDAVGG